MVTCNYIVSEDLGVYRVTEQEQGKHEKFLEWNSFHTYNI